MRPILKWRSRTTAACTASTTRAAPAGRRVTRSAWRRSRGRPRWLSVRTVRSTSRPADAATARGCWSNSAATCDRDMMTRREKIEAMLADDPGDTFLRYSLAMELGKEGDHAASLAKFAELTRDAP